jgi:hypothetical protein
VDAVTPLRASLVFAIILLSYLLSFLHLVRWKRLSADEALALSVGVASLIFGAAAFTTHAFGTNQRVIHVIVLAVLWLACAPGVVTGISSLKRSDIRGPLLFVVFLSLIMLLQLALPIYIGGAWYFDWWQHYNLAQLYMGKVAHDYLWLGIYNFASRTPLMNLNAAFFLSVFGDNYWVYQIVASILNSAVILPVYLVLKRLMGARLSAAVIALMCLSPSIVHNAWYPWPKLFAAYFALMAAHFYLEYRRDGVVPDTAGCVLVFALIWTGFLAHQSTLFSSGVILIDMFVRALRREPARFVLLGLLCAGLFLIINGVWFTWATSFFGIKKSFLSYYERPATVGGLSGYMVLFTYHTLATVCSPLFVYDVFGSNANMIRFYENIQVLYYNSFAGFGTVTVFAASLAVLTRESLFSRDPAGFGLFTLRPVVRRLLALLGLWTLAMAALVFGAPLFGDALFSHYFNHPGFARVMFGSFFIAGGTVLIAVSGALWLSARRKLANNSDSAASLLFWMTVAGFAGGIATHHELYIHGMVSAGSATAVLLSILFLGRVASSASRLTKALVAVPIFCESFLITWFPILIVHNNWGWSGEKNWQLKQEKALAFLADLFPDVWRGAIVAGLILQAGMLIWWASRGKERRFEQGSSEGG